MYNKIFTKILDSSIWLENNPTRIVWMTFIAAMDETGFCAFASPANLARRAIVTDAECEAALHTLTSPDANSSDPDHEGRRIERVPGGWLVLNAEKYRLLVTRAVAQEKSRDRLKRWRELKRSETKVKRSETPSEAEAEAEALALAAAAAIEDQTPPTGGGGGGPVKCPLQIRAERLFNRRASTPWTKGELTAWKTAKAIVADATEQEWADLAAWFALPAERAPYRRNGFAALLNNWQDEIIRARRPENRAAISAAPDALAESEAAARRAAF